ncbi:MAG TPA: hypothetical protein VMX74_06500 [Pirellulales bacterium]|nr:hypothetical protein [Pirellulales bacterium]
MTGVKNSRLASQKNIVPAPAHVILTTCGRRASGQTAKRLHGHGSAWCVTHGFVPAACSRNFVRLAQHLVKQRTQPELIRQSFNPQAIRVRRSPDNLAKIAPILMASLADPNQF